MRWPDTFHGLVLRDAVAALVVVDLQGQVRYANEAALEMLGRRDVDGLSLAALVPVPDRSVLGMYLESLATGPSRRSVYLSPMRVRWAERDRWVDVAGRPMLGVPGFRGLVLTLRDVTEFQQREVELAQQASTDPLTGLANRRVLDQRLSQAVVAGGEGSVLVLDLDAFKRVNDTFGHERGDEVLREVARRLEAHAPQGSTVARLGGDEFCILMPGVVPEQAVEPAQALVAAVAEPIVGSGSTVQITASAGLAPLTGDSLGGPLRAADLAMYQVKSGSTGPVGMFGPESQSWLLRSEALVAELARLRADNERLQLEAHIDPGTGLPNLRWLLEDLPVMAEDSRLTGQPFAVVFIDLDHFGALNKYRGDEHGDAALRQVADVLTRACRATDTVYRKGGEELVALLPGTDLDLARRIAERFRAAIEAAAIPHGGLPHTPVVTASLGVAVSTSDEADAHAVLVRAGHQMLRAKRQGRNLVLTDGAST